MFTFVFFLKKKLAKNLLAFHHCSGHRPGYISSHRQPKYPPAVFVVQHFTLPLTSSFLLLHYFGFILHLLASIIIPYRLPFVANVFLIPQGPRIESISLRDTGGRNPRLGSMDTRSQEESPESDRARAKPKKGASDKRGVSITYRVSLRWRPPLHQLLSSPSSHRASHSSKQRAIRRNKSDRSFDEEKITGGGKRLGVRLDIINYYF